MRTFSASSSEGTIARTIQDIFQTQKLKAKRVAMRFINTGHQIINNTYFRYYYAILQHAKQKKSLTFDMIILRMRIRKRNEKLNNLNY